MKIVESSTYKTEAIALIEELSEVLEKMTGSTGKSSFNPDDVEDPRASFVIAYDEKDEAIGCGAIRPLSEDIAEVKRMYAKNQCKGVGTEILKYLELKAQNFGYSKLYIETRVLNEVAVSFYKKRGYHIIPNYGQYANRPEAVCFEKNI